MLMSMFSSFDALGAESFGQKVSLSWAPGLKKDAKLQGSPIQVSDRKAEAVDGGNKSKEGISSLPTSLPKKPEDHHHHQLRQQRKPRFAVELDGVHCFETIIPY